MSSVASGPPLVDGIRRFTVTITMEGSDGDGLMRLASVFHRRQVEVLQATYQRVASTRWMVAIVETSASRMRTVALTLHNAVGVTGCEISPTVGDPLESAVVTRGSALSSIAR